MLVVEINIISVDVFKMFGIIILLGQLLSSKIILGTYLGTYLCFNF